MRLHVLDEEDIERIHGASLDVLESTGVWFHGCPDAAAFLEKHGCKADGIRVRFPRALVEDCLARLPDRDGLTFGPLSLAYREEVGLARGVSHFVINGNAYTIYDYEKGAARDCVEADQDDKELVFDRLPHFTADVCELCFHAERMGREVTGPGLDDAESARAFLRRRIAGRAGLGDVALSLGWQNAHPLRDRLGRLAGMVRDGVGPVAERLAREHGYVWINPLSPLQYHPEQTRVLLGLANTEENYRLVMISPELMMGATAPVTLAGALVQHNAEVLTGLILTELARPGMAVMYGCVSAPMDLRNAQISHGNVETALLNAAAVQLADRYGMPSRICPGNTSERRPGVRAAVETAVGIALGLAAGGNVIMTGTLDSTLMLNYEHLVVTDELIAQLTHAGRIRTDAEGLAVDVIAEHGHPSAGYLTSDHTLRLMQRDVYYSGFCGRVAESYEDWYEKAHRQVREILAQRDQPIEDRDLAARVAAVEARLKEDSETWRDGQGDWWSFYVQDFA